MAFNPITVNKGPSANPHIYAEDDAAIFQSMFGEDGILDIGSKLELSIQSNNLVRMSDGALCVGGHIGRIKYADYVDLIIDNGETGHNRNDLIIGSFRNTGEHTIDTFEPQVVKGTPATGDAVDPTLTEGSLYEGEYLRQVAVARVKLEGLNIVGIDMLLPVIPSIPSLKEQLDELNRKLPVFKRRNSSEAGICTPHYIMIMGTLVLQGANADYRQLFSASDLLSKILKFYDPSISNFDEGKCVITTNNGDGNAAAIHFYAPEWWGSNNAYFQYFYPATSGQIRVNYCIHYLKL